MLIFVFVFESNLSLETRGTSRHCAWEPLPTSSKGPTDPRGTARRARLDGSWSPSQSCGCWLGMPRSEDSEVCGTLEHLVNHLVNPGASGDSLVHPGLGPAHPGPI